MSKEVGGLRTLTCQIKVLGLVHLSWLEVGVERWRVIDTD